MFLYLHLIKIINTNNILLFNYYFYIDKIYDDTSILNKYDIIYKK